MISIGNGLVFRAVPFLFQQQETGEMLMPKRGWKFPVLPIAFRKALC